MFFAQIQPVQKEKKKPCMSKANAVRGGTSGEDGQSHRSAAAGSGSSGGGGLGGSAGTSGGINTAEDSAQAGRGRKGLFVQL